MTKDTIDLFMWGYQSHFRIMLRLAAEKVFEAIKAPGKPQAMLVGVRRPGITNAHPICIDPEYDAWPLSLFDDFDAGLSKAIGEHAGNDMFYTNDPKSNAEKPERIRTSAIKDEVRRRLKPYDDQNGVVSFCGTPTPVDKHYVVPVVQIPAALFHRYPAIERIGFEHKERRLSFIEECMRQLLKDASIALWRPDAGHHLEEFRPGDEVAARAAQALMREAAGMVRQNAVPGELFTALNDLAQLRYEGAANAGSIVLADAKRHSLSFVTRLATPVHLSERRWCRKLLQMASDGAALLSDCEHALGVGRVEAIDAADAPFVVSFIEQGWDLHTGDREIIRVRLGRAQLPGEPVERTRFDDNVSRIFAGAPHDLDGLWAIWNALIEIPGGALAIIAADAEAEAVRLARQGMRIEPALARSDLLSRARRMDGALLIDPMGRCHAIGVILDGEANDACTASRGSRFNSAVRYVRNGDAPRVAFILSDDLTANIEPMLRPRVSMAALEGAIARLEAASLDEYLKPLHFLDENRFYLDAARCDRINAAVERIGALPKQAGRIYVTVSRFKPHPDMCDAYLIA
jgi:hypothetical protein